MRFPYHCCRSYHLRFGRRAFKIWMRKSKYIPPEFWDDPLNCWQTYFPKKVPQFIQLELF